MWGDLFGSVDLLKKGMALVALAAIDIFYQWWKFEKDLRMTKQEVKDENKQLEGDPQIKGKRRQLQRRISQQRMMQNMIRGLYTATTGMMVQRSKMDVLTNNIVNAETVGYKTDNLMTSAFDAEMLKRVNDPNLSVVGTNVGKYSFGTHDYDH